MSTNGTKTANKMYYDKLISKSKNKTKTTWKIIKKEIGNNNCQNDIPSIYGATAPFGPWPPS
jgi:hypothetical protein